MVGIIIFCPFNSLRIFSKMRTESMACNFREFNIASVMCGGTKVGPCPPGLRKVEEGFIITKFKKLIKILYIGMCKTLLGFVMI